MNDQDSGSGVSTHRHGSAVWGEIKGWVRTRASVLHQEVDEREQQTLSLTQVKRHTPSLFLVKFEGKQPVHLPTLSVGEAEQTDRRPSINLQMKILSQLLYSL